MTPFSAVMLILAVVVIVALVATLMDVYYQDVAVRDHQARERLGVELYRQEARRDAERLRRELDQELS